MGQQQLLLIIVGVIIVGIAVAVGIAQFDSNNTVANKDGLTSGLTSIGSRAYEYKLRPGTLGGGNNSYVGFVIPNKMLSDDNGVYAISSATTNTLTMTGTSSINSAWVATITVDSTGKSMMSFVGW
ncbi:MAG TPA: hypothetical protein VLY03_03100 [Bacteroidota bacterium]|nr:hypothetical protein [Bacteroidota bacterium]